MTGGLIYAKLATSKISRCAAMIQLSPSALQEVLRLGQKQADADLRFRLSTARKGCLDRSYVMQFDKMTQASDRVIPLADDLELVVNAADLPYLEGLAIDYSEDMMGGGFRFYNPNTIQVCSCGNSFSVGRPKADFAG